MFKGLILDLNGVIITSEKLSDRFEERFGVLAKFGNYQLYLPKCKSDKISSKIAEARQLTLIWYNLNQG